MRRATLLALMAAAACGQAPEPRRGGGFALDWPALEPRVRDAELARHTEESGLTLEIDYFNVDFEWNEAGNTRAARYLVPAVAGDGDKRVSIKYRGEDEGAPAAPAFVLQIPGVPLMTAATMRVEAYARGLDAALMSAEVKNVEVTPEGVSEYKAGLEFTAAIDADQDGYIPAEIGGSDCRDDDAAVYAGAPETCDGRDTACDGRFDEVTHCAYGGATDTPMQTVPAGTGYVGWASLPETPRRKIYHHAFAIDRYEVSLAKYAECATCGAPASTTVAGIAGYASPAYGDFPVMHVDWWQAQKYCGFRGKRLPTEFEWEVAARGFGDLERSVPWQEATSFLVEDDFANVLGRGAEGPNQVAALSEGMSPFGVYNLMGNAAEWTSTWYAAARYDAIDEKLLTVPPAEPPSGTLKVHKGGGWDTRITDAFPYRRAAAVTDTTAEGLGFRCAKSL